MSETASHYIICYDIVDAKRLRRVHRLIRDYAMPVQYSVFEAELNQTHLDQLIQKLEQEIKEEDNIMIYQRHPSQRPINLGQARKGYHANGLLLF